MKRKIFPPQDQSYTYLQTNRSDDLGSLWATFNLDFQSNLGTMRLSPKLVANVTSATETAMKVPVGFEIFSDTWFCVTGSDSSDGIMMRINVAGGEDDITEIFSRDLSGFSVGSSTTRFDVTNPSGTTFRYTYDGTGTNPNITTATFPTGATVTVDATNMATGNEGTFTITGSGANYFEVTNASGVVESDKTIGTGYVAIAGGTISDDFGYGSDIKSFNDFLWATSADTLWRKDNNEDAPWENFDTMGTSVHQIQYFKKFDRLYFVHDDDQIFSVGTDDVIAETGDPYALELGNLDEDGYISCILATNDSFWVGTSRRGGSSESAETYGLIFQWDGISAQITNQYKLETGGCLALCEHEGIVYAVDSEGRILKQTGYSFSEIARLPIDRYLLRALAGGPQEYRFIHFNGFVPTKNNTLLLNVANRLFRAGSYNPPAFENLPGGVWELDLATNNLTHKASYTYKGIESSTITDYGQNIVRYPGAIRINTLSQSSFSWVNGRASYVAGAGYFTDSSTMQYGIHVDSPALPVTNYEGQRRGYYVTTFMSSDEVSDKWNKIYETHKRLATSGDKFIYKYRLEEEDPTYATITWVNTTSFTTTTNISAYGPTATGFDGTYGGEVEVIQGTGSGCCVHITNISENAGTYTVTVDNAVTGVTTGTAIARFQKWKKLTPEVTSTEISWSQMAINASNPRIQIKCVLELTGDGEFHKFLLTSNSDITATL